MKNGRISAQEKRRLEDRFQDAVVFDFEMAGLTSLGVGGPADAMVSVKNKDDLKDIVKWTAENNAPFFVLGRGTNLLVSDAGVRGVVIRLKGVFKEVRMSQTVNESPMISAGAGAGLPRLCSFAIENGLEGLNWAVGIPGTVGGAILMNAGTHKGCVADSISAVRLIDSRAEEFCLAAHQAAWSYRKMDHGLPGGKGRQPVIYKGLFKAKKGDPAALKKEAGELLKARKKSQPQGVKSAGSFFRNPPKGPSAGELIDKAGLKGVSVGGAQVSKVHANFIVNRGNASAADILELMTRVQTAVSNAFGIDLEPEVKIVGS